MRIALFIISFSLTIILVIALNSEMLAPVPLGKLLSPQEGLWQNAENVHEKFNENLKFPGLKGQTEVYFDDRLVPHIFAENEEDA